MSEIQTDPISVLSRCSANEKRQLLAALTRDLLAQCGSGPVPIVDEDTIIAYLMPFVGKIRPFVRIPGDPYSEEILRRAATPEDSIPLEQFIADLEAEDD